MKDKTLEDAKSKAEAEMDAARAEGDETAKKALEEVNVQVAALKEEAGKKMDEAVQTVIDNLV